MKHLRYLRSYNRHIQLLYHTLTLLLMLTIATGCARTQSAQPSPMLTYEQIYAYDHDLPLNAEVTEQQRTANYVIYRVQYNSVHDKRVPAWWCVPTTGTPPYPCVLIMHGYGGDKKRLADSGSSVCRARYRHNGNRRRVSRRPQTARQ